MNQMQTETDRWDLYMNGVFRSVLEEILGVHRHLPDQILYMQPHANGRIARLRDNPPTPQAPIQMWISTGDDPANVSFKAEIVGWEDKDLMSDERIASVSSAIEKYQEGEKGMLVGPKRVGVNLLHVRRMRKLDKPFPVRRLIKVTDGKPRLPRTMGGGWSYVRMGRGE